MQPGTACNNACNYFPWCSLSPDIFLSYCRVDWIHQKRVHIAADPVPGSLLVFIKVKFLFIDFAPV